MRRTISSPKRDKLVELTNAADLDTDAIEALNVEIEAVERNVNALKASEARIGANATGVAAPAVRRPLGVSQQDVKPSDLIVRSALVHFISKVSGKSIDAVLEDRYPGHEPTSVVTKADATIATTTTSGWASQLVNTAMQDLLELLTPFSIYPGLSARGIKVTFNNNQGAITIPSISTDAALAGGFVLEGDPIPVGRFTTTSISMAPHKFGIITTMSKEAAKYTTPALEGRAPPLDPAPHGHHPSMGCSLTQRPVRPPARLACSTGFRLCLPTAAATTRR